MAKQRTSFAEALKTRFHVNELSGCWIWIGARDKNGYGIWQLGKDRLPDGSYERHRERAHRLSWELHKGPIPIDMLVLHRCDNPSCVNPEHLFIGTHADNSQDMSAKGRASHGERQGSSRLVAEQVIEIRATVGTLEEIAAKYGVSTGAIDDIKNRRTWKHIPGNRIDDPKINQGRRGSAHGTAKLTEADIPIIRGRRATGEKIADIAEDYGITDTMVSFICSRKSWGHVP